MHFSDLDIDIPSTQSDTIKKNMIKASINENQIHASGVYFYKNILHHNNRSIIDYKTMEQMEYQKIDILNNTFLDNIGSEKFELFLNKIENEDIDWEQLYETDFLYQLNNYPTLLKDLKVTSVNDVSIALGVIRPGAKIKLSQLKRNIHTDKITSKLSEKDYFILKDTYGIPIFQEQFTKLHIDDDLYRYKKPHAIGYAYVLLIDFLNKTYYK